MAKIYVCPDGATCVRFDDNTGWWTYAEGRSSQLIRPWRWHRVDDQVVADAVVEEVHEDVARRYAKIGGPWVPRVHAAETQAQIEDAWRSRLGEYPETAHEALQVISDITGTCPVEATTMVVADVFALARTLVRKIGVSYEDDDWDLVGALRTANHIVDAGTYTRAPSDPVHVDQFGWWFWNETWDATHGPFGTEVEARQALSKYAETL